MGREKNYIWMTRTAQGYCVRYRGADSSGYLTPEQTDLKRDPVKAGYVSFPEAICAIVNLSKKFYADKNGVDVKIDSNSQIIIPVEEQRAVIAVVVSLERMAEEITEKEEIIKTARRALRVK